MDEQKKGGPAGGVDERLADGVVEDGRCGGTVVDENVLVGVGSAGGGMGGGDEPVEGEGRFGGGGAGKGDQVGGKSEGEEIGNAVAEVGGGGEAEELAAVGLEVEGNGGMGKGVVDEDGFDVGLFGLGGAKEFAAGGEVVKEVADGEGGAGGAGDVADRPLDATFDGKPGAKGFAATAGLEGEAGNGGDGGEGFAAEAESAEGFEVVDGGEFGGGVALEGGKGVGTGHAGAVVGDFDEGAAALEDGKVDMGGAGVKGVFEEFLDDGGRTFNDFAGGYLVGDVIGKGTNGVVIGAGRGGHETGKPRRGAGRGWLFLGAGLLGVGFFGVGVFNAHGLDDVGRDVEAIADIDADGDGKDDGVFFFHGNLGDDVTDFSGGGGEVTFLVVGELLVKEPDFFGGVLFAGKEVFLFAAGVFLGLLFGARGKGRVVGFLGGVVDFAAHGGEFAAEGGDAGFSAVEALLEGFLVMGGAGVDLDEFRHVDKNDVGGYDRGGEKEDKKNLHGGFLMVWL